MVKQDIRGEDAARNLSEDDRGNHVLAANGPPVHYVRMGTLEYVGNKVLTPSQRRKQRERQLRAQERGWERKSGSVTVREMTQADKLDMRATSKRYQRRPSRIAVYRLLDDPMDRGVDSVVEDAHNR